ncbi:hypothetical protein WJ542_21335 [Paraburkholderia sp. B3]|uniref:hypothetical protein n=1 Tax=Paraburkholderia sp. B3 TaxID=3134791 RepID=UPI0039822308
MTTRQLPTPAVTPTHSAILTEHENPLLINVPTVPTLGEAMRLTQVVGTYNDAPVPSGDALTKRLSSVLVTNAARARVLMTVLEQVRSSYLARDLRDAGYRNFITSATYALHRRRDRCGYDIPLAFGIAPNARPRGIFVAAPVRTGRRSLAATIESLFRREAIPVRLPGERNGFTDYMQLPVLRIQWPIGGKIQGLARNYIGTFALAMNMDFGQRTQKLFFRDRDTVPALCALSIAANLGLLIVERINTIDASTQAAEVTWDGLAQFTRMTGVPVLCLATPGAAIAGLSKLPGALGDLAPTGPIEITPAPGYTDRHWNDVCRAQYDATIGSVHRGPMPDWLPKAAYEMTLGYPGILAKVLSAIALELHALKVTTFSPEIFNIYGKKALALDQNHLDAIRIIRQGAEYKRSSLYRYGDWLSFSHLTSLPLGPEMA